MTYGIPHDYQKKIIILDLTSYYRNRNYYGWNCILLY